MPGWPWASNWQTVLTNTDLDDAKPADIRILVTCNNFFRGEGSENKNRVRKQIIWLSRPCKFTDSTALLLRSVILRGHSGKRSSSLPKTIDVKYVSTGFSIRNIMWESNLKRRWISSLVRIDYSAFWTTVERERVVGGRQAGRQAETKRTLTPPAGSTQEGELEWEFLCGVVMGNWIRERYRHGRRRAAETTSEILTRDKPRKLRSFSSPCPTPSLTKLLQPHAQKNIGEFLRRKERERERGDYCISHSFDGKASETMCILEVGFLSWFDTGIGFKDPELVYSTSFDMSRP